MSKRSDTFLSKIRKRIMSIDRYGETPSFSIQGPYTEPVRDNTLAAPFFVLHDHVLLPFVSGAHPALLLNSLHLRRSFEKINVIKKY